MSSAVLENDVSRQVATGEPPVPRGHDEDPELRAFNETGGQGTFAQIGRTFYGEIWEDDADNPIIADFLKCHFHRPILRVLNKHTTRRVGIRAANQIGKTRIGELAMKHRIKHDPSDMVMYDIADDGSNDHMKARFMPLLRSIPEIKQTIDEIIYNDRFDVTTQDILFPGMVFRARPLNDTTIERITVRYGMISDARLTERKNLIERAFIRSRQNEGRDLWVVESFGGVGGDNPDDFASFMAKTDDAKLQVECPCCGGAQLFKFTQERGEGFQARLGKKKIEELSHRFTQMDTDKRISARVSCNFSEYLNWRKSEKKKLAEELELERKTLTEQLLKDDRKMAGFKRGDELLVKLPDGEYNEREIMRGTYYECYHCGQPWLDTPETRKFLDHSVDRLGYVPSKGNVLPGYYGFSIPAWINPKISWGSCMLKFLQAMKAKGQGNLLPLEEFQTKWAGEDWDEKSHMSQIRAVAISSVDPSKRIENELFRSGEVDCQKDKQLSAIKGEDMTGHFWVTAWATDKAGNDVQLWRGYCTSWEEWINKFKELGVPTKNISIDASFKPDEIKPMAARHAEIVCSKCEKPWDKGKPRCGCGVGGIYATWTMMRGSDQHSFRWADGVSREYRIEKPEETTLYSGGQTKVLRVNVITWSNYRFKHILNAQLMQKPGVPRMTRLPDNSAMLTDRTRAMESSGSSTFPGVPDCSWEGQMNSETLGETAIGHKPKFVAIHKENHYRDCCCMHIVRKMQAGVAGRTEIMEQEAQKAE